MDQQRKEKVEQMAEDVAKLDETARSFINGFIAGIMEARNQKQEERAEAR